MTADMNLLELVSSIGKILTETGQTVTTVESCTGGGIAYSLTAIPGSSNWFNRGFVTYSNSAKTQMVDVPEKLLEQYGAVSNEVAESMATGGLHRAGASYAVSVTGIAGPGGGTADKPVGSVCFGWAGPGNLVQSEKIVFPGDRQEIRSRSIEFSLSRLIEIMRS
jgi:nicotinamide-nucleotide amidase